MQSSILRDSDRAERAASSGQEDPVLAGLHQAEHSYQEFRARCDDHLGQIKEAETRLAQERQHAEQLARDLRQSQAQLEQERKRAERARARARQLADGLKHVHRSLFEGNVFHSILKACLLITGASRGLYITAAGQERLRARAAIDVNGYPQAPLSDFLKALCLKVLNDNESFVCNGDDCFAGLPRPTATSEQFHNCIVAPVLLLHNLNGVVIIADKINGDFDHDDVETVLSVGDQAAVAVENGRLKTELQSAYLSVIAVLADAVEAKDPYTHGHCEMVARLARLTAERLQVSERERGVACYGGLLHDIGKIGVSDGVLNKPGALLPEEWSLMRSHVRVGRDLLARVPALASITDVVFYHHERYDGQGYPEGLKGEEIPLAARIVCVVDAYCAMVAKRSYKDSYSDERARAELVRCRSAQFDPAVVDAFLVVLDTPQPPDDEDDGCCQALPHFLDPAELRYVLQPAPASSL